MSFWDDLLKVGKGVVAQVNPFDGGQDFNSVVNNRPARPSGPARSPAVEVRAKTPVVAAPARRPVFGQTSPNSKFASLSAGSTLSTNGQNIFTQPKPAATSFNRAAVDKGLNQGKSWEAIAKETGTDLNSVRRYSQSTRPSYGIKSSVNIEGIGKYTKNTNGSFTEADGQIRTPQQIESLKKVGSDFQKRQAAIKSGPLDYAGDIVGAPIKVANDFIVKPTVDTAKKAINTVSVPVTGVTGLVMAAADKTFNGGRNASQILKDTQAQMNENIDNSFVSRDVASGKASSLQFAKEITNAGVETASILPAGRAISGIKGAANGLSKEAIKDIIRTNSKMAGVYGTASTANDVMQGREITPEGVALNYGAPLALGAGSEVLGVGGKQLANYIRRLPQETRNRALIKAADGSQTVNTPTSNLITYEGAPDRMRINEYKAKLQNGEQVEPLYVMPDETGKLAVEDGKHRLQAMNELGIKEAPVYVVTPERLKQALDPLTATPENAASIDANIARLNDASPKSPSTSNLASTIESSSDQIVPLKTEALQAEAKSWGILPETNKVDVVNPREQAIKNEAIERGLIDARRIYEQESATQAPVAKDSQILPREAILEEAQARSLIEPNSEVARSLRIKGRNAQAKEYLIPVSTPETRRVDVNVTSPRGNRVTEYAAVSTLDDAGNNSYELVPLDKTRHELKNGMVIDKNGKSVGSYVGIDDLGNQYAYVEGKPVNINGIIGDINSWGNLNKILWDMDRLIEANAPNKDVARKVQNFTTVFKDQQEARMKVDLVTYRTKLQEVEKNLYEKLPSGISKKELTKDMFRLMENKPDTNAIRQKYGDEYFEHEMKPALNWAREQFDQILNKTNKVLERNGFDPIPRRDNYITHIQNDPKFWEKVGINIHDLNPFGSSVSSDVNPGKTRGGIPDGIVGNTANTSARKRWNPFAQSRKGDQAKHDFFAAIDAYYEPMLFNQYMTPAASRARIIEKAFRTFDKAQDLKFEQMAEIVGIDEARKARTAVQRNHSKYKEGRSSPLVIAWQEYGNILAGKTNSFDRMLIDRGGDKGKAILDASTKLQGIAGASSIPGSATAALAQILSLPQTLARDSSSSVLKAARDLLQYDAERFAAFTGVRKSTSTNDPLMKSSFMRVRYTNASSKRKTLMRKYTSIASKPMEGIERQAGELSWRSAYHEAMRKGLKDMDAIRAADIVAKKTLAGRGIGDRPVVMNSKAAGIFTQFGLEVNNMRIQFWRDFTPAQKVKFLFAAAVLNTIYGSMTGQTPLPDYIKASLDTFNDLTNSNDDQEDSLAANVWQGAQRLTGETSKFIPAAPALASIFLSDKEREQVFGKGGDMSRFGTPALAGPIRAGVEAVKSGTESDIKGVRDSALSVLPTGAQVKRTIGGAEALNQGYVETGSDRVNNTVDKSNPMNWAQGLTFGKYALPGQQEALNSGKSLSELETTKFKEMRKISDSDAIKFFKDTMESKITKQGQEKDKSATELKVDRELNIRKGTWKEVDGTVVDAKSGNVVKSYYKDLVKNTNDTSDKTYDNYIKAYGLKVQGEGRQTSTGNSQIDLLNRISGVKDKTDTVDQAISLLKQSDKSYKEIPSWVVERYMDKNGIKKDDALYAAKASYDNNTKLKVILEDIKGKDHNAVMKYLTAGRLASIKNTYWATSGVLSELRDRGVISKAEYSALYRTKLNKSGQNTSKYASRGSGGGGSRKGRTVSAKELRMANATLDIEKQLARILKAAGSAKKPKAVSYKRRT